jgi:hypothetical protein
MFGSLIHHHIIIIDCWLSIESPPKLGASLDASLGRTPFKHVPTITHKGTPNREKGTPQGNKGIQTHEKPINANEDNVIKGKEPQTIIGTPPKDVVAQVAKDNKLKEKVQEAKDSPTKQKPPLVKKGIPMRDKAPNP